jgi:hypothetical protein
VPITVAAGPEISLPGRQLALFAVVGKPLRAALGRYKIEERAMADEEHLQLLSQGEHVWNEWRRQHPEVIPDLAKAELQSRQLAHFDLSKADLRGAALMGAELRHANFSEAKLQGVKINDARAPYANFTDAQLQGAYLR